MKNPTPERKQEMVRLLEEIRADLAQLRAIFERLQTSR